MKTITLNNGVEIPIVGLGTFRAKDNEAYEAVLHALKVGYRHIDTAAIYQNEEQVGRAIKDSGLPREDIFVTSKLWPSELGFIKAKKAFKKTLSRLGLDYLDLYLIHWPGTYSQNADAYLALEDLYHQGHIRSIGVSNFGFHHLEHLLDTAQVIPQVNQVEMHVRLQNHKLHDFCMKHGIHLEAYAPLMSHQVHELLEDEILIKLATKYQKTVGQIALKYLYERDVVIIPKSTHPKRIEENLALEGFSFDDDDEAELYKVHRGRKIFPDPDNVHFF